MNLHPNYLKVMSFNIRYGTAHDGQNSWEFRKEAVFEMLGNSGCAIIGMQEVLASQLHEIQHVLPHYHFVGVGREDGINDGEYCAILFDSTRVGVESSETFWFSETPSIAGSSSWGNRNTRICTRGTFIRQGTRLDFYNLHIDHESSISRSKSIELLAGRVSETERSCPIIVTGDFNDDESSLPIELMEKAGFEDTYRSVYPEGPEQATFHNWTDVVDGAKIDYVFVMGGFKVIDASIVRDKPFGFFVSDHYPVTATVELVEA